MRMRNAPVYRSLVIRANLEEQHIIQTYRLNRQMIMVLVTQSEPDLLPAIRHPSAIPPTAQVLSVLHFLASGSFQIIVGLAKGMSQPMFINVLRDALLQYVRSYIRFSNRADVATVNAAFYDLAHVPHVIEATDGTHIALVPPRRSEEVYRNRKNFYFTNVQVVCLADQYITQVTARFPGSVHDSYIPWNSTVQRDRAWLIGDSGYPNLPWLLTPMRHPTTAVEYTYNEAHGRTRRVVERTLGLLMTRFRCLHISGGAILCTPQKVCQIIVACCMLHNLTLRHHIPLLDAEEVGSDDEEDNEDAVASRGELIRQYLH
ncbi:putative nuclease HARBI1 [Pleurodeles waltl]|uniref:putative nuclease HARBI1 n=1 Tax=Pleurodeles waltl TaxID=8319 RepID=UPI0037096550